MELENYSESSHWIRKEEKTLSSLDPQCDGILTGRHWETALVLVEAASWTIWVLWKMQFWVNRTFIELAYSCKLEASV
jgi:hypothetical protein